MPSYRKLILFTLFASAVFVSHAPAAEMPARDPDLPPIDRPGTWRLMTPDADSTSSQCVGDPNTALCAIETVLACALRKLNDLCRAAMNDPDLPDLFTAMPTHGGFDKYRVVSVKKRRFNGAYGTNRDGKKRPYVYTKLAVDLMINNCLTIDIMVCGGHLVPTTYFVLKLPDRWQVTGWETPRY